MTQNLSERTYSRFSHHFRNDDMHAAALYFAMQNGRYLTILGEDVTLSRTYNVPNA